MTVETMKGIASVEGVALEALKTDSYKHNHISIMVVSIWYRGPESNRHSREGTGF